MNKYIIKCYCNNCLEDLSYEWKTNRLLDIKASIDYSFKLHRCKDAVKMFGQIIFMGVDLVESDNSGKQKDTFIVFT